MEYVIICWRSKFTGLIGQTKTAIKLENANSYWMLDSKSVLEYWFIWA